MQIFLSWSGFKSKAVAETLKKWLVQVIQAVEPWTSTDIAKGTRWNTEVSAKLGESKLGIICLTRENLDARWLLFEAGAISKVKDALVCTLLLDITPAEVEHPLSQFQHTIIDRNDIRLLIHTINKAVGRAGEREIPDATLDSVFETFWPQLEKKLSDIGELQGSEDQNVRTDRAILEEIVEILRNQEQRRTSKTEGVHPIYPQPHLFSSIFPLRSILTTWMEMREPTILPSKKNGIIKYMRFDKEKNSNVFDKNIAILNKNNARIVTHPNASIAIIGKTGRKLEKYQVRYGDKIKLPDGSVVVSGQDLIERDPHSIPILTEVGGKVAFGDIVDNVTVVEEIDKITGLKFKMVIGAADNFRPRIAIKNQKGRTVKIPGTDYVARYLLPVGTYILVDKGDDVLSGDVLGKLIFPPSVPKTSPLLDK